MKIPTTNTDEKNMRNNGPHTITSTQVFRQSVTINGIVSKVIEPHIQGCRNG